MNFDTKMDRIQRKVCFLPAHTSLRRNWCIMNTELPNLLNLFGFDIENNVEFQEINFGNFEFPELWWGIYIYTIYIISEASLNSTHQPQIFRRNNLMRRNSDPPFPTKKGGYDPIKDSFLGVISKFEML